MRIFLYLYILKLIAYTAAKINPKAVNVQLETVLEFNEKDKEADVKFIGNIQKILKKVKIALTPESGRRSFNDNNYNNNNKHIPFTDFIIAAVNILLSYDDDDLQDAFYVLDDEIRKYHYKGCKFYELLEDENVRKFVARKLDNLKKNKANTLRRKLEEVINLIGNAKLIPRHRKFLNYINSLYRHESSRKFISVLQNLENYSYKSKRSNMNLVQLARNGIQTILFDYYSKLNPNVRKDIKKNIENTWNHNENSKQKHSNKYMEEDFVNIITNETKTDYNLNEDEQDLSSSMSSELNSAVKIDIHNDMNKISKKKNHVTMRHRKKKMHSFTTLHPEKNTIKQTDQKDPTDEIKLEHLGKKRSTNETDKQKDDFLNLKEKVKPHRFERKKRKDKSRRKEHKKIKPNVEITENVENNELAEVKSKSKRKKHHKLKANVEKTENVEDNVIVNAETRNNLKSESVMTRSKTEPNEELFINFRTVNENRNDKDSEAKAPPRKLKQEIKRKQFRHRVLPATNSHSDEGLSIEYGSNRRTLTSHEESAKEKERHKQSAEAFRKHFITRINNLEKQMDDIFKKNDDTTTNETKIITITTENESEINNDSLLNNTTVTSTEVNTQINKLSSDPTNQMNESIKTTLNTDSTKDFNITDNVETNRSVKHNDSVSEDESHLTDYDYSEAGIMKNLNISINLPQEDLENPDGVKNKNDAGLITIPIDIPRENDNEIIHQETHGDGDEIIINI